MTQDTAKRYASKSTACRCISSISQEIAYHQNEVLHIIKSQLDTRRGRDDIQPKGLMISTTLRAVMIYQVCDLDKKDDGKRIIFHRLFGADYGLVKQKQQGVVFVNGVRRSKERDKP